jgi:hypothetical protein
VDDLILISNTVSAILSKQNQKNAIRELKDKAHGLRLVSITKDEVAAQIDCMIRGQGPKGFTLLNSFLESLTEQQKTNLYKIKEIILEKTI